MEKRKLDKNYAAAALEVWRAAFAGDEEFDTDFCMRFFSQDNLWQQSNCWLDGDKLISTYFSLNVELLVRNKHLTARYIDGIATLPEYQGRGLVTNCMTDDISECYKMGVDLMLTDPARDSIYRNVGFEYSIDKYNATIPISYFNSETQESNYSVKVEILSSETIRKDYNEVNKWLWEHSRYNELKWPKSYEDVKFWRNDISIAMAYDADEKPQGYMLYKMTDGNIYVLSIRYASLGVLNVLKQHIISMTDLKLCHFSSIPPDFPFEILTKYLATPEHAIVPRRYNNRMARVINFEALLEKMIVVWPKTPIIIKVDDDIVSQNNAFFTIFPEKKIQRLDLGKTMQADSFAALAIKDTASLLCGMTSAEELYYGGRLVVSDYLDASQSRNEMPDIVKQIDNMLPKAVTFNADEYLAP